MGDVTVIRSAVLRGFRATVAELGGDAEALATEAGVPIPALDTDDLQIELDAVVGVLDLAAARLPCPDLGLRIAGRQDLGTLGPLALAMQSSTTVGEALECASRYLYLHGRSLRLTVEPDPHRARGVVAVRYARETGTAVSPQGADLALGFIHRALLSLADGRYGLRSVELPHEPAAALPVYEEFFGAPVKIRRPEARLRVPRSLLAKPLSGSNESMRRLALAFLAQQVPGSTAEVTPRVHAALAQGLGTANSDISSVARLLAIHPRTLQRRLAAEGTTFAAVLDEVRRDAAWRYLTATDLPMNQIAGLLGLSEQSVLTRCCRRWWQQSPSAVRRAAAI